MEPSTTSSRGEQGTSTDVGAGSGPVAADRPVVDGTGTTAQELRDEVEQLQATESPEVEEPGVEELRADMAATAEELAARVDVPARLQATKEQATDRLRTVVEKVREQPAALLGAAGLLVLAVVLQRRTARRRAR